MIEQEKQKNVFELSKDLRDILDEVLTVGDWKSSLFLRNAAAKLQELREKSDKLFHSGDVDISAENVSYDSNRKVAPLGYLQVFVLLYQVEGANLQGWYRTIKTLADYSITRPVYKKEEHVKEFIRSKVATPDRNAYVVVNVKEGDCNQEQQADQFAHPLVALKEGAIKLENVVEFVHSNKKRYAIGSKELIFLGEV